jgi:hypothetical protein
VLLCYNCGKKGVFLKQNGFPPRLPPLSPTTQKTPPKKRKRKKIINTETEIGIMFCLFPGTSVKAFHAWNMEFCLDWAGVFYRETLEDDDEDNEGEPMDVITIKRLAPAESLNPVSYLSEPSIPLE